MVHHKNVAKSFIIIDKNKKKTEKFTYLYIIVSSASALKVAEVKRKLEKI